jgi:hypothetical protein
LPGETTLSIATTLSIMTFSITTLSIMKLTIMGIFTTVSIEKHHNSIMLSVVMLSVIMLSVVAP